MKKHKTLPDWNAIADPDERRPELAAERFEASVKTLPEAMRELRESLRDALQNEGARDDDA
ncbi:hypothetical protein [Thioalkalivibrio sp. ALJ15]|uniref:hypothetical protein n=1 Tax=Thioalkalivibrio sp. ALJ15 TaxID=748652 RepID=UPI000379BBFA|nr:hypothetical protein [Thioalkalivibrio sp. ALJ15]